MGEEFSKEVEDFNISIINKFNQQTLSDFFLEENVRKAVIAGLHELGRIKPKNPTKFLGEFFINYK